MVQGSLCITSIKIINTVRRPGGKKSYLKDITSALWFVIYLLHTCNFYFQTLQGNKTLFPKFLSLLSIKYNMLIEYLETMFLKTIMGKARESISEKPTTLEVFLGSIQEFH